MFAIYIYIIELTYFILMRLLSLILLNTYIQRLLKYISKMYTLMGLDTRIIVNII